jgi:hypothetical protein
VARELADSLSGVPGVVLPCCLTTFTSACGRPAQLALNGRVRPLPQPKTLNEDEVFVRFACSFNTTCREVDDLVRNAQCGAFSLLRRRIIIAEGNGKVKEIFRLFSFLRDKSNLDYTSPIPMRIITVNCSPENGGAAPVFLQLLRRTAA